MSTVEDIKAELLDYYKKLNSCNQCEYETTSHYNLTTHKRTKHKEVQYHCDECEYQATTMDTLITHKKSKHLVVTYKCDQCQYVTIT